MAKKKIECEHGMNEKLQKVFKTSHVTVRRALRFESKSDLSNRIRSYALKNGGILFESSEAPVNRNIKII